MRRFYILALIAAVAMMAASTGDVDAQNQASPTAWHFAGFGMDMLEVVGPAGVPYMAWSASGEVVAGGVLEHGGARHPVPHLPQDEMGVVAYINVGDQMLLVESDDWFWQE